MKLGEHWGKVVWAVVFALLVIGTAAGTYFFERSGGSFLSGGAYISPNDADRDGLTSWEELAWHTDPSKYDTDGDGASDGAEVTAGTNPLAAGNTGNAYETAAPTTNLLQNLAEAQVSLGANPSSADSKAAVKGVAQSVSLPDLTEKIPLSALRTSDTADVALYAEIAYRMLATATAVRQYELSAFRDAVLKKNYYGTPSLKDAAAQYKAIEAGLIAMEVPTKYAMKHLAMVNAVGTLANIVSAMGNWTGDPFAGLAYMNAFSNAEVEVQSAIGTLFDTIHKDASKS